MSILLPPGARIIAVSATGPYGRAQIAFMNRHGSSVVAVVAPGRTGLTPAQTSNSAAGGCPRNALGLALAP